jgi:adhesin transport system outer membrane protein
MKSLNISVFVTLGLIAQSVIAQPTTLEALASEALAGYPSIQARESERNAALADLDAARWQRFPTPEIQASQNDSGDDTTLFRLQQPLWTGGRINAGVDAAKARVDAAGSGIGEAEEAVLTRLIEAYVAAARRQAQQRISVENVRQHEELRNLIQRRVDQQISPKVDLSLADSRLAQASSELSSINQQLSIALNRLGELAGRSVKEVSETLKWAGELPESRERAEREAVFRSPALTTLEQEQRAASADVRAERAKLFPIVAVRLEHERGLTEESRALLVLESEFDAGLSTVASTTAASSRRDALRQERLTAERELRTEVSVAWQQWLASQVRLENAERQRQGTRTVFESYTRQYVIGQKSWLDVLNAVQEATAAALSVEDARAEMRDPMLRLALLTGRLGLLAMADSQPDEPSDSPSQSTGDEE